MSRQARLAFQQSIPVFQQSHSQGDGESFEGASAFVDGLASWFTARYSTWEETLHNMQIYCLVGQMAGGRRSEPLVLLEAQGLGSWGFNRLNPKPCLCWDGDLNQLVYFLASKSAGSQVTPKDYLGSDPCLKQL